MRYRNIELLTNILFLVGGDNNGNKGGLSIGSVVGTIIALAIVTYLLIHPCGVLCMWSLRRFKQGKKKVAVATSCR